MAHLERALRKGTRLSCAPQEQVWGCSTPPWEKRSSRLPRCRKQSQSRRACPGRNSGPVEDKCHPLPVGRDRSLAAKETREDDLGRRACSTLRKESGQKACLSCASGPKETASPWPHIARAHLGLPPGAIPGTRRKGSLEKRTVRCTLPVHLDGELCCTVPTPSHRNPVTSAKASTSWRKVASDCPFFQGAVSASSG